MDSMFDVISYQEISQGLINPLNSDELEAKLLGLIHAMEEIAKGEVILDAAISRSKRLEQLAKGQREGFELAKKSAMSKQTAIDYAEILRRDLVDLRRSRRGGHI
jgi:hypothetical protein